MRVKDMDFEGNTAARFAVVLHLLHIVFGLMIPQESTNHCDNDVPRCFLHHSELLGEFFELYDLYWWSSLDIGFDFCRRQLREEVSEGI